MHPQFGGAAQDGPAYPHPDDIDLHEQQHPVEDNQQPREAESQLREADVVVVELDKLDGLGDEGQRPVGQQGCGGETESKEGVCVPSCMCKYVGEKEKNEVSEEVREQASVIDVSAHISE